VHWTSNNFVAKKIAENKLQSKQVVIIKRQKNNELETALAQHENMLVRLLGCKLVENVLDVDNALPHSAPTHEMNFEALHTHVSSKLHGQRSP